MAETQVTEQITAPPREEAPVKVKDPRRVAAGKALAARNKAAREAKKQAEAVGPVSGGFNLDNIMQVAAVVGAGFTLYHGYQTLKPYLNTQPPREAYERPVVTEYVRPNKATTLNTISEEPTRSEPVKDDKKEFEME